MRQVTVTYMFHIASNHAVPYPNIS